MTLVGAGRLWVHTVCGCRACCGYMAAPGAQRGGRPHGAASAACAGEKRPRWTAAELQGLHDRSCTSAATRSCTGVALCTPSIPMTHPPPPPLPLPQTVINDIFATMKLGVPIIKYTMYDALNAQQKKLQDDLASWDNPHNVQHPELRWPEEWLWLTGGPTSSPNSINMTIPYMGGAWDERVAGKRFPPRGNYSTAFLKVGRWQLAGLGVVHRVGWAVPWGDQTLDWPAACGCGWAVCVVCQMDCGIRLVAQSGMVLPRLLHSWAAKAGAFPAVLCRALTTRG